MKKTICLLIFLFLTAGITSFAQGPEPLTNLQSPNIASLGLYGEVPVSLFTGTPSIHISLYDIEFKEKNIPISLSYHSSGIKPDQHPGWVGLGWNLNTGGAIYRVINDIPDDYNNKRYMHGANAGYYFNHSILNTPSWNQRPYLRKVAQENGSFTDTAPDEFSFHFLNYSGKFYLDHERNWVVQCNKPLKVVFNNTFTEVPFDKRGTRAESYGYSPVFSGFTLIGEDGTQYIFGGSPTSIEYSIDFFKQWIDDWVANAWYLTKIITTSPARESVNFSYERGNFIDQMYISVHDDLGTRTESKGGIFSLEPKCSSLSISSIAGSTEGRMISPVYLRKVDFNGGSIVFNREISNELKVDRSVYIWKFAHSGISIGENMLPILESEGKRFPDCLDYLKFQKLTGIQVLDAKNRPRKSIVFEYNDNPKERLLLLSLSERTESIEGRKYQFEYTDSHLLPPYLSNKVDHWGYYNATYANKDNYDLYYKYRETNPNTLMYGLLSKITYPTGGYTQLVFEPHQYRKQLQKLRWEPLESLTSNKYAGGVRIKKIINSSTGKKQDEWVDKEYYYTTDYLQNKSQSSVSSGVLGGQVQYYFTDYTVYAFNSSGVRKKMSFFSTQSVLPVCSNSQNSHIGYTEVIEKYGDGSFKRHQYTNFDNGYMDESCDAIIQESRIPYENYASKEQERGLLINQETYNSTGVLKHRQIFTYQKDKTNDLYVRAMKAHYRNICPNTAVSYDEGVSYKIYTYTMILSTENNIVYNLDHIPISTSTTYTYNRHKLPSEIKTTNSEGETETHFTRYSGDITNGIYLQMQGKNMLSYPVEKIHVRNQNIVSSELLTYKENGWTHYYDYVPDKVYKLQIEASVPFASFVYFDGIKQDNRYGDPEIEYARYNNKSKVEEIIYKNFHKTTYFWGYNDLYPVARFENAQNNHKRIIRYQDVRKTKNIRLQYSPLYQNIRNYDFYMSKAGDVEVSLSGMMSFNWFVSGSLEANAASGYRNMPFQLVSTRRSKYVGLPWSKYSKAYTYKAVFTSLPVGHYTLRIAVIDASKDSQSDINEDGEFSFTYWGQESTAPEISGNNDVYYNNFEYDGLASKTVIPFGFNSNGSYVGSYSVLLATSPDKNYYIDYQVYKNGRWNYVKKEFKNGTHTIDESLFPIDDIRVYPQDATATSYNHIPLVGLKSQTNGHGITESYEYDDLGRLVSIRDNNMNMVKTFDYIYYNQSTERIPVTYYNVEIRKTFTRNNCDLLRGEMGGEVTYTVPAGKYSSSVSQEEADKKAYDDLAKNGQQYANENGECSSNIIVYVYNPTNETYFLAYNWGIQGSIRTDYYEVPPSPLTGVSDDILKRYEPVKFNIPRRNYRSVRILHDNGSQSGEFFSIKSFLTPNELFYSIEFFPGYEDIYVIGGYPFLY